MTATLQNGVRQAIGSLPQDGAQENAVAVIVEGGAEPWVLHFWATLRKRRTYIGSVRIFADHRSRLVAIAAIPGAHAFECEGRAANGNSTSQLRIDFEGLAVNGGPWGVQPIPGNSIAGARSYRVASGVGGPVLVTGEVLGWSAWTTQAGATVAILAAPALTIGPIAVPQNGAIHGDAQRLLAGVSTWTFTNTDHYMIEFVPPGPDFDG